MVTKTSKPRKPRQTISIESIRPAIEELERIAAWTVEACGLDYLTEPVTVVVQSAGQRKTLCGWFRAKGWSTREGKLVHEITLVAEKLKDDVVDIAHTVIHEVIHLHNHQLKIVDCASNGRHNKLFKERAEIAGLIVSPATDSKGHGYTSLGEDLKRKVESDLKPDVTKLSLFRLVRETSSKKAPPSKWSCQCTPPINVRCSKQLEAECRVCLASFELQGVV